MESSEYETHFFHKRCDEILAFSTRAFSAEKPHGDVRTPRRWFPISFPFAWDRKGWRVRKDEQIFGPSDQEKAFVERADKGFGIMMTGQGRVPFYNNLTEVEYGCFTTKPEGVEQPSATVTPTGLVQLSS